MIRNDRGRAEISVSRYLQKIGCIRAPGSGAVAAARGGGPIGFGKRVCLGLGGPLRRAFDPLRRRAAKPGRRPASTPAATVRHAAAQLRAAADACAAAPARYPAAVPIARARGGVCNARFGRPALLDRLDAPCLLIDRTQRQPSGQRRDIDASLRRQSPARAAGSQARDAAPRPRSPARAARRARPAPNRRDCRSRSRPVPRYRCAPRTNRSAPRPPRSKASPPRYGRPADLLPARASPRRECARHPAASPGRRYGSPRQRPSDRARRCGLFRA